MICLKVAQIKCKLKKKKKPKTQPWFYSTYMENFYNFSVSQQNFCIVAFTTVSFLSLLNALLKTIKLD